MSLLARNERDLWRIVLEHMGTVLWTELCPPKIHVKILTPNMTAFEVKAFKGVIKVE